MRLFSLSFVLFLAACAGTSNVTGLSYAAIRDVANTVREECGAQSPAPCLSTSTISTNDRDEMKAGLELALGFVDDAERVRTGGVADCGSVTECLERSRNILSTVENILIARGIE